jgi:hypothetical protein
MIGFIEFNFKKEMQGKNLWIILGKLEVDFYFIYIIFKFM